MGKQFIEFTVRVEYTDALRAATLKQIATCAGGCEHAADLAEGFARASEGKPEALFLAEALFKQGDLEAAQDGAVIVRHWGGRDLEAVPAQRAAM